MDKEATYRKSAKGMQAIATRDAALPLKLRSMLILVDGRRPYAELAKLGAGLGNPDLILEQLENDGFIESGAPPAWAPTAPAALETAPAPAAPAPKALNVPLAQAQRFAVRRLTDLLGPTAQDLCLRIEATRNAQEFLAAIQRTETVLRAVVGANRAAQFVTDIENQRAA